jgi:hypothetical protein
MCTVYVQGPLLSKGDGIRSVGAWGGGGYTKTVLIKVVLFPLRAPALGSCDAKQSRWTSGSGLLGMMPGLGT